MIHSTLRSSPLEPNSISMSFSLHKSRYIHLFLVRLVMGVRSVKGVRPAYADLDQSPPWLVKSKSSTLKLRNSKEITFLRSELNNQILVNFTENNVFFFVTWINLEYFIVIGKMCLSNWSLKFVLKTQFSGPINCLIWETNFIVKCSTERVFFFFSFWLLQFFMQCIVKEWMTGIKNRNKLPFWHFELVKCGLCLFLWGKKKSTWPVILFIHGNWFYLFLNKNHLEPSSITLPHTLPHL